MSTSLRALAVGLTVLVFACGSNNPGDQQPSAAGGGATLGPGPTSADGGSAEIPPLTEEELRRMLDALEQEIDDH